MKKVLKLLVAIILAIAILGFLMFLIDCSKVKNEQKPIFAREVSVANDGGTIEYMGLGYKIIDFNRLNGYDETKIGFWNIKYEDYEEEYKKLDKNVVEDESNKNNDEIMDNEPENEIISGDIEVIPNPSGDVISGDALENDVLSGDNTEINNEEIEKEEGHFFNATIIGINKNNLVVQALENEAITASADMFSFSYEGAESFLIGQKVKIKYTGTIRETYPAGIDVLGIEIIE